MLDVLINHLIWIVQRQFNFFFNAQRTIKQLPHRMDVVKQIGEKMYRNCSTNRKNNKNNKNNQNNNSSSNKQTLFAMKFRQFYWLLHFFLSFIMCGYNVDECIFNILCDVVLQIKYIYVHDLFIRQHIAIVCNFCKPQRTILQLIIK